MSSPQDSHGCLARWALTLQPYDFSIVHRSGTSNPNMDRLWRGWGYPTNVGGVSGISTLTKCETPRREFGEKNAGVHGPVVNGESDLQAGGVSIVHGAELPQASMKEYGFSEGKAKDADWSVPRNDELGTIKYI